MTKQSKIYLVIGLSFSLVTGAAVIASSMGILNSFISENILSPSNSKISDKSVDDNESQINSNGFTMKMLFEKTFFTFTEVKDNKKQNYYSVTTFHHDGTSSISKNGDLINIANYHVESGYLYVEKLDSDTTNKFEIVPGKRNGTEILKLKMYEKKEGKYSHVANCLVFAAQKDLDIYLKQGGYLKVSNDLFEMKTKKVKTIDYKTLTNVIGMETNDPSRDYFTVSFTQYSFSGVEYKYDGTFWKVSDSFFGRIEYKSGNTVSIIEGGNEVKADLFLAKTEQVLSIGPRTFKDLFITDLELHVTDPGAGWDGTWVWKPIYRKGDEIIKVVTNEKLKEMLLRKDFWLGGANGYVLVGNPKDVSGDIIRGIFNGFIAGCTPLEGSKCTKYKRTNVKIGSWSFDPKTGVTLDLPNIFQTISVDAKGQVKTLEKDKVRSVMRELWFSGSDATDENFRMLLLAP